MHVYESFWQSLAPVNDKIGFCKIELESISSVQVNALNTNQTLDMLLFMAEIKLNSEIV
jgi:hypothetical protein